MQELASVDIYCGSASIGLEELLKLTLALLKDGTLTEMSLEFDDPVRGTQHVWSTLGDTGPVPMRLDEIQEKTSPLPQILQVYMFRDCTDARDNVDGLVGLTTARDDPSFVLDYSLTP